MGGNSIVSLHRNQQTNKVMNTQEQKVQNYNEAKDVCMLYIEYKGDKRSSYYKRIERAVFEIAARRVNNFGKQLGLPTFNELRGL